jgi:hypothetical protein
MVELFGWRNADFWAGFAFSGSFGWDERSGKLLMFNASGAQGAAVSSSATALRFRKKKSGEEAE